MNFEFNEYGAWKLKEQEQDLEWKDIEELFKGEENETDRRD